MLTATRKRRPRPASPGLALGHLPGDHQGRQVPRGAAGDEAPARRAGQPGPVGDEAQHQVLRVDRAGRLQPGDALDRRARDEHVEQQRGLGRRGRDEAEEPRAVGGDHRRRHDRGVGAQHLVRVVRLVAEQAPASRRRARPGPASPRPAAPGPAAAGSPHRRAPTGSSARSSDPHCAWAKPRTRGCGAASARPTPRVRLGRPATRAAGRACPPGPPMPRASRTTSGGCRTSALSITLWFVNRRPAPSPRAAPGIACGPAR